jgi:anti-anti-sigma regulatory factor
MEIKDGMDAEATERFKNFLISRISSETEIVLDLSHIKRSSYSFLQILFAANIFAKKIKKKFTLCYPMRLNLI